MTFTLDHLAVAATDLDEGRRAVEEALGVPLETGGRHDRMGTWNALLGLGPALYLEVIAIDPDAPAPGRPRWFGLDGFAGAPRLTSWIVATDDLDAAMARLPQGYDAPFDLSRGDLSWRMAIPTDGTTPFDGTAPLVIEWRSDRRPPRMLTGRGCRLSRFTVTHPDVAALRTVFGDIEGVTWAKGPPGLAAIIATPGGSRPLP